MCVCDDPPVGAVHVGVLDARCVAPVRPVDLTEVESGTVTVSLLVVYLLFTCCQEVNRLLSGFKTQLVPD